MKKLLLASIIFCIFSLSLLILQSSCTKSVAQPTSVLSQQNKIIYFQLNPANPSMWEIWTANYDGTNATQIPITLPANVTITKGVQEHSVSTSPDGKTIFFSCDNNPLSSPTSTIDIYSCDITGGVATLVVTGNKYAGTVHAY